MKTHKQASLSQGDKADSGICAQARVCAVKSVISSYKRIKGGSGLSSFFLDIIC